MDESELAKLARRIYVNHKAALDYIFEQRPDFLQAVKEHLEMLIGQRGDLVLDHSSKSIVKFAPSAWSDGELLRGDDWSRGKRILLFEFQNSANRINLALLIGPGDVGVRQRLFDFARQRHPLFRVTGQGLYTRTNQIWSRRFADARDLEDENVESINLKLDLAWKQFLMTDLPAITSAIDEFKATPGSTEQAAS